MFVFNSTYFVLFTQQTVSFSFALKYRAELVKTDKTSLRVILNEVKGDKLVFHDTEVGPVEVYPFEIKSIQFRSLKRIRTTAVAGASGGFVAGIIIGANQIEESDCGFFP